MTSGNLLVSEMTKKKAQYPKDMIVRPYKLGDETQILSFLNLCYGEWGTIQKWHARYTDYPTFNKDDIVLMEVNKQITGHGSTHFRDLIVGKHKLYTASLTDAAIHPLYRGKGLYAKLIDTRLKMAKSRGACLIFAWHLKGSNAHKHNKKIGFIEVKQFPVYMKVIRPEKVIKSGLFDLLHKNPRLKEELQKLKVDIYFCLGKVEFSIAELLKEVDKKPRNAQSKVKIVLDKNSLFVMANFRNMSKLQRITNLIMLILLRKAKIRFGSFKALLNLAREGVAIIGSI